MPSKRKKNKRRMRRAQAQRMAMEEQYTSSGKGTQRVCAASAPVPARVPVAKISECPISVPIPVPVVASVEVPAEVSLAEPVVLEIPVTGAIKDEMVKPEDDPGQSLIEPPAEETAVIEDDEIGVPESEVTSSTDEPVSIPAESEIQFEDTIPVATEIPALAQAVETADSENEAEAEVPAEVPVLEVPVPEEMVTRAELVPAVEDMVETVVAEEEPVVAATVEVVEVLSEPVIDAEAITVETESLEEHTATEVTEGLNAVPETEAFPPEAAVATEALVEAEAEHQPSVPLEEPTPSAESTSDPTVQEFVVTRSVVAVDTSAAEEQIPETTSDAPDVVSETHAEMVPAPEPLPVPVAKEVLQAQGQFMAQIETETIKDLAVAGGLTVDAINGCLGATEVTIEG